ncbi:uncharacterized protein LOC108277653 [Ictalurus punctatus]|uniref:Uncharacterized protein LOC108277653 n=1 Tax=Ictalurus punctatus TaxID=7998 RepID=A0A9F7TS44_ICTPU|nr:uncharacterized protein LOC108277653 [Ictalurus punctatus]
MDKRYLPFLTLMLLLGVSAGTVLCDACSPESEAEKEIEENLCRSSFGFSLAPPPWRGQTCEWSLKGGIESYVGKAQSKNNRWQCSRTLSG